MRVDFVGHVGGDDFVQVLVSDAWRETLESLLARFTALVPTFYDETERRAGGIAARDRRGQPCFFDLLSLSIGVVRVQPGHFHSYHEVAARASDVKHLAKQRGVNTLFIDRRRPDGADEDAGCARVG